MVPWSLQEIEQKVTDQLMKNSYNKPIVFIIGILLARPAESYTKEYILPHLSYWSYRSGNILDIFCAGYEKKDTNPQEEIVSNTNAKVENQTWRFSEEEFSKLISHIENSANMELNGGKPYILLLNAVFHEGDKRAHINYQNIIVINICDAVVNNDVTSCIEQIRVSIMKIPSDSRDPLREVGNKLRTTYPNLKYT